MAYLEFKVFLSCSFAPEDRQIVEFFKSYCESFGFEVLKYDFQEPIRLSEGIKSAIKNADCLIAVATRKSRLESGEWICPDWIEHEVVFANAVGKPVAIFAEEDVRIEGLILREERYQRFSRDESQLLRKAPEFNKFFMALYHVLERLFKSGLDSSPILFRHLIRSRDELIANEQFETNCEIEVESLVDDLKRCDHGFGDIDWLQNPCDAVKDFEFSVLQAPSGITVHYEMCRSKENPNDWSVVFDPPLRTGQRVSYAFRYTADKVRAYTVEQAQKAISTGQYWSSSPLCAVNWELYLPTGELTCEVAFPPKYPIHEPNFTVEALRSGTKVLSEIERIRQAEGFKVQRFFDRYTLILSVSKPVKGYRYLISWQPPSASELVHCSRKP